jgi:hypothetical protein
MKNKTALLPSVQQNHPNEERNWNIFNMTQYCFICL